MTQYDQYKKMLDKAIISLMENAKTIMVIADETGTDVFNVENDNIIVTIEKKGSKQMADMKSNLNNISILTEEVRNALDTTMNIEIVKKLNKACCDIQTLIMKEQDKFTEPIEAESPENDDICNPLEIVLNPFFIALSQWESRSSEERKDDLRNATDNEALQFQECMYIYNKYCDPLNKI